MSNIEWAAPFTAGNFILFFIIPQLLKLFLKIINMFPTSNFGKYRYFVIVVQRKEDHFECTTFWIWKTNEHLPRVRPTGFEEWAKSSVTSQCSSGEECHPLSWKIINSFNINESISFKSWRRKNRIVTLTWQVYGTAVRTQSHTVVSLEPWSSS